jgi:hypothetical protein
MAVARQRWLSTRQDVIVGVKDDHGESHVSTHRFIYWCFPDFDQTMDDHKDENHSETNNMTNLEALTKAAQRRQEAEEGAAQDIMPIRAIIRE